MDPVVDLAPGAEHEPLAVRLAAIVRGNLRASAAKRRDFEALRGTALLVGRDSGDALSLRFDHGRLVVHEGQVGVPTVTLLADVHVLASLVDLPLSPLFRLPTARLGELLGKAFRGEVTVYGAASHPRFLVRLLRVLSVHA